MSDTTRLASMKEADSVRRRDALNAVRAQISLSVSLPDEVRRQVQAALMRAVKAIWTLDPTSP